MLVKTYQAENMSEALRLVKAELGGDAMIISSREQKRKGLMGLFARPVCEVTAALDNTRREPIKNPQAEREEKVLSTREEFQNSMLAPLAREIRELKGRVEAMSKREEPKAELKQEAAAPVPVQVIPCEEEPVPSLKEQVMRNIGRKELDEIRQLLMDSLEAHRKADAVIPEPTEEKAVRPVVFKAEPALEERSEPAPFLEPVAAKSIVEDDDSEDYAPVVKKVERNTAPVAVKAVPAALQENPFVELDELMTAGGLDESARELLMDKVRLFVEKGERGEQLKTRLVEAFAAEVKCAGPMRMKRSGSRIIALAGPTGVGKTTTAAKLAASYALNKGTSVAFISIDNFRVGAVEQLQTYSRIMGIPLETASTAKELSHAIDKHSDKELILIDTAGINPRQREKLEDLREFLDAHPAIETHLCMAATTRDREMAETLARFRDLPVSKIIFTKMDECESFGSIANVQLREKIQLSWFTNGQKVPEDIEAANSKKLADLVLRENV